MSDDPSVSLTPVATMMNLGPFSYDLSATQLITSVLEDQSSLEWLLLTVQYHHERLTDVMSDALQVFAFTDTCYLLDFDIIRDYLEPDSFPKPDQLFVDLLFSSESTQDYALPAGAFLELLDWLPKAVAVNQSQLNHSDLGEDPRSLSQRDTLIEIARTTGIPDIESLTDEELLWQISQLAEELTGPLSRLLQIVDNPRFVGVVSDYDREDAIRLTSILRSLPRTRSSSSRTKRDSRDAINLAVVFKRARMIRRETLGNRRFNGTGYILVTQTTILLNLLLVLDERLREGSAQSRRDAARQIGFLRTMLGAPTTLVQFPLPCMTPRRVIVAEAIGAFDHSVERLNDTRRLKQDIQIVAEWLNMEAMSQWASNTGCTSTLTIVGPSNETTREVDEALKRISRRVFQREDGRLFLLEELRRVSLIEDKRRLEQSTIEDLPTDDANENSLMFLGLLSRIALALDNTAGFHYECLTDSQSSLSCVQVTDILQRPAAINDKSIVSCYSFRQDDSAPISHFEISWTARCSDKQFLSSIRRLIDTSLPFSEPQILSSGVLRPVEVSRHSELWSEGFLVYTSHGLFGFPLTLITTIESTHQVTLPSMLKAIRSYIDSDLPANAGSHQPPLTILQYRVNTQIGDFAFDIQNLESDRRKYVTVITHSNLSDKLASLYSSTTLLPVSSTEFQQVLDLVLAQLPPINSEAE